MSYSDEVRNFLNEVALMKEVTKRATKFPSRVTERKYKCTYCLYSSDNLRIVQQHMITHYVRPQVCPYCQEVPAINYNRTSLYRQDKSRFKSRECSVVFSENSERHDVVFNANYVCELCGNKFRCILHSRQKKRQIILLSSPNENKTAIKALKK